MSLTRRFLLAFALLAGLVPAVSFAQAPPPVPALPDTERRQSYSIVASTCACSVNMALLGDATDYQNWLEVFINGKLAPYNDPVVGWAITSPTGSLSVIPRPITDAILTFNLPVTGTIQIVGARRPRRVSQFNESQGVPARALNQTFTDVIAMQRELWDKTNDFTGRGIFSQPGNTLGLLPLPAACVSAYMAFDSTGLNPVCLPSVPSGSIGANTITNAMLAAMAADTIKCNPTSGSANAQDCTQSQIATILPGAGLNLLNGQTVSYPIANTDCSKTVNMVGIGLTATLPSVSGFQTNCVVTIANGNALAGVFLSGFPGGLNSSGILWPTQSVTVGIINGAWNILINPYRWQLQTTVNFYVRPDGSDSNDGLANSSARAWLTPNHGFSVIADQVDINQPFGGLAIVNHTCGTPPCTITAAAQMLNIIGLSFIGGAPEYIGNCGTPTNVKFSPSTAVNADIQVTFGAGGSVSPILIGGFELAGGTNANYGMYVSGNSQVNIFCPMQVDAISSTPTGGYPAGIGIGANSGGHIYLNATLFYTANIGAALSVTNGGYMENGGPVTVNTSNTPAWTNGFVFGAWNGTAALTLSFNGTGATGNRCAFSAGASLYTNGGLAALPGTGACSVGAGTVTDVAGNRAYVQ
jgi:hypothetical protein